jgi:hypothetical protein
MTVLDQMHDAIAAAQIAGIPHPYRMELGRVKTAQLKEQFEAIGLPWFYKPGSDYTVTWGGTPVDLDSATPGITVGEDKS